MPIQKVKHLEFCNSLGAVVGELSCTYETAYTLAAKKGFIAFEDAAYARTAMVIITFNGEPTDPQIIDEMGYGFLTREEIMKVP